MDIGPPKRIIEINPEELPLPALEPIPEPVTEPAAEPEPTPAQPSR